ncbi:hypothetical protein MNB_SM-5-1394 [hydrothermal vent metagenome]|uniref:Uncharacterized protein n=1 Tax=hydrothermal vent metagenome TaxID=652676 RepID=A0A1W1CWX5_9ZZZZ
MNSFMDILMLIFFGLFMIFVFGGYHKTKFEQREKEKEKSMDKES